MSAPTTLFARPGAHPEPSLSLRDWLGMVWRQLGLILLCTVIVGGFVAWLLSGQQAPHASTARVWVQTEQQGTPSFLSGIAALRDSPYPDPVNRKIETEMELMLTRSSVADVIKRLGVREEQLARKPVDHVKARLRALFPKKAPAVAATPAANAVNDGLVDLFLKGVKVEPLRSGTADTTSNVLEVSFECADPALAPKALQALLDNYLRLAAQQNRDLADSAARLIDRQLAQARDELRSAEDDILALSLKQVGRTDTLMPIAPTPRATAPGGMRLDMDLDVGSGGRTQVLTALKTQTQDLQAQLDQARQLYTEDSENVKGLRDRLKSSQARLRDAIGQGARADVEMSRLERVRNLAQDRFVELRKRLDQIYLYLQLNPTETNSRSVIDKPTVPLVAEGGSGRGALMLLGPLVGLLLGLLLAGVREFLDSRLRGDSEVRRTLGLTVLAGLPVLNAERRQQLERAL